MREIKFRGLSKLGEWIYGNYATTKFPYPRVVIINNDGFGHVEVLPKTVGQFTGLKDSNGVDIYEGDIAEVTAEEDYDGESQFLDAGSISVGRILCHISGLWLVDEPCGCWLPLYHVSDYAKVKIVGNIHEKPELLKP